MTPTKSKCIPLLLAVAIISAMDGQSERAAGAAFEAHATYLGFDRNDYPGDQYIPLLRKTFRFTGYWLNVPPGATTNTWVGKRAMLQAAGVGFAVLFNGRLYQEIRSSRSAEELGKKDAAAAITACMREGFHRGTVIFLDQEEGGRMLPEQRAYLHAWVDGVNNGGYHAGVYCSAIPALEAGGTRVITAIDIKQNAGSRRIVYWVSNDSCLPSPGCVFPRNPPLPITSGVPFAAIWQFAQSPRRKDFTASCAATYNADGNCYPPTLAAEHLHVDVNSSGAPDPSGGRTVR